MVKRVRLSVNEIALLIALLLEILFFAASAPSFATWGNFFEVLRFSVELGLLAVALTPILITGGIDLSVGSTIGITAVLFGVMTQSAHWNTGIAIVLSLLLGLVAGGINAALIAGLRLPPLIVTLGTYSLYRGVAEGITHGAVSFTGFSPAFLHFGQGYFLKVIPVQLPLFLLVVAAYWVLLHRSVIGRALYAIGFNAEGARYAGIPVRKRIALIYVLSGLVAALAGIIYVAHLGLAKSDLGTGYELQAIAAIVLGGTSVFGGRGTIFGSLLGLFFLSVLQNGMHLMALPSELNGVLTGVLLLLIVSADQLHRKKAPAEAGTAKRTPMIAVAVVTLLAVGVFFAMRSKHGGTTQQLTVAVMPKAKGDPYFISARAGAEEAAKELHVNMIWDGPTSLDASQQNELVENWITRGVNAIVVAVENKGSISTVLRKAREHGIAVLTWDADAKTDARDYFLNQATPEGIGTALADEAALLLPQGGDFAIVTGALSAENQNDWIRNIKARVAAAHPNLRLATIQPSDDDRDKAFSATQTILKAYPQVKMVIAISAPAVPGAAEAVQQSGRSDVDVIGLSLPSICRTYIHRGTVQAIYLWNTKDLGYLTVYAGAMKAEGKIPANATSFHAGRLGDLTVQGSEIILGKPLKIDRSNVDQLQF
ncbi:substrate-binding domain-containing protein [Terriglobus roseus]|uniref:Autoinducer 2 import system permease protein LsrD n=1 Tax=Terriglobus roseus TaxID=392734 RepID=A0A1G7NEW7_9BACT|nr:substrate-binding domain-containing protein [Terriglobus roseus]SDF72457.1 monosaccharide ABC transporter substrate-binding protein, CUT2 family /monosaccharide ABC transporter membrane protein, CUT2 family [Terriglobus roseus]